MEVADFQGSATVQTIQETTVADQLDKAIEKPVSIYTDIYGLTADKDRLRQSVQEMDRGRNNITT